MPAWMRQALEGRGLMAAYRARPAYQRNDWVGWIQRAKRGETKERRLRSMLGELRKGGVYLGMKWRAKPRP